MADVSDKGFEPPKTCAGFVEMSIRASAWAVVRCAAGCSAGKRG